MLFERFRNVVQAILTTETTKISGLRPDSQKSMVQTAINPPLVRKRSKTRGGYGLFEHDFGQNP